MPIARADLQNFLTELLQPSDYADYGPNGLQIEGTETLGRIAFAVSATADSARLAVEGGAQALIVHHGLFWKFHGPKPLTGPFARRVFPLVRHGVNLFAYHLPLDAHPEVGNAASLARALGMVELEPFGDHEGRPTGIKGRLAEPMAAEAWRGRLGAVLEHPVMMASPDPEAPVRSAGIITGGANRDWPRAVRERLDAYVTGEMSEHDWHESQEAGLHMYAGGHNATERFGILALMAKVEATFAVDCFFIPSGNPA